MTTAGPVVKWLDSPLGEDAKPEIVEPIGNIKLQEQDDPVIVTQKAGSPDSILMKNKQLEKENAELERANHELRPKVQDLEDSIKEEQAKRQSDDKTIKLLTSSLVDTRGGDGAITEIQITLGEATVKITNKGKEDYEE